MIGSRMKKKKIIFIDMDGVIVNYDPQIHGKDGKVDFASLAPVDGAIEAVKYLCKNFDVFIATTAPWDNPKAWMDKRLWIGKHLPELKKRIFMTHRKDMLIGDYLIDDRPNNGAENFPGTWVHFGHKGDSVVGFDWTSIVHYFKDHKLK